MKSAEVSIFLSARQDVVDILESDGKTCVLIKEAAASLYHAGFDTEIVHIVIMSKIPGLISEEEAKATLIRYDPDRFKCEGGELRYCEPSVIPPKKNWCRIVLIPTPNPPPPQYEPNRTKRLLDLPVASPLSIISDAIAGIQIVPEKGRASKLLRLLDIVSRHELVTIDEEHIKCNGPVIREDDEEELDAESLGENEDTEAVVNLDLGSIVLEPPSPSKQITTAGKFGKSSSAFAMPFEEPLETEQMLDS
ncbi:unnamed protein product [Cyclocybe aegerita]|uniref:Uncharacterized protein n=1 Tax=Cyclocybe aegerita TaxID=1973307 RepID=A0A8S0VRG8_CYCAE|nr:unnamed protein product [Cyclocybe aegerita]